MESSNLSPAYTLYHLPVGSTDWAGILAQFALAIATHEGKSYAAWAGERIASAIEKSDGLVALSAEGKLLGFMLFEVTDSTAEITFPWTLAKDPQLTRDLAEAIIGLLHDEHPHLRWLRIERQLLPGEMQTGALQQAGFACHWRQRMTLELAGWRERVVIPPGFKLVPWDTRFLDAAAEVMFRANLGTLDAKLYAPFFGESPAQCRKGLLTILVGKFGPLHPRATLCAFHNGTLAGINLVIEESSGLASIVEISVEPAYQRRGLGRALMVKSLGILQHDRFERVELAVTKANTGALQLYESLGFIPHGDFPVCVWPETA